MSDNLFRMSDYRESPPQPANRAATLKPRGGGDNSDGMDPWQQTVETRLGDLRSDIGDLSKKLDSRFLWLLGAFAAGFVLLGGLMLDRTDALSGKMDDLAQQVGGVRAEVAALRKPAP